MTVDTNILRYLSRRSSKNYNTANSDRQTDRFKEKDSICVRVRASMHACMCAHAHVCMYYNTYYQLYASRPRLHQVRKLICVSRSEFTATACSFNQLISPLSLSVP